MSVHIGAKPGDIAESILLPGDPLRAKYIAENFLEDPVCFNEVRGMLGFTGTYKGKKVSVMGTGMGMPSISIYATELMREFGVKNLIRIGTCGTIADDLHLRDVVLAMGCCTDSQMNNLIFPGSYCPVADFQLLRTAYKTAKETGINVRVGNAMSGDAFYGYDDPKGKNWKEYGVLVGEMEGAALYTCAAREGCRALMMVSVTDGVPGEEKLTSEERQTSLNTMITLALDTAVNFQG